MELISSIIEHILFSYPSMSIKVANNEEIKLRLTKKISKTAHKCILCIKLYNHKDYSNGIMPLGRNHAYVCYSKDLLEIQRNIDTFVYTIVWPEIADNEYWY